jgi:hypothetical protein
MTRRVDFRRSEARDMLLFVPTRNSRPGVQVRGTQLRDSFAARQPHEINMSIADRVA